MSYTIEDKILRELKAYYEESDAIEKKSFSSAAQYVQGGHLSGSWSTDDSMFLTPSYLRALFEAEDWVYIIVDLIAMKVSNQYLRVMKQEIIDGKAVISPAEDHPLQKLLSRPNNIQDYHSWMYTTVVDLTLIGNCIQWFTDNSIYNLPADNINIDFDRNGIISKYRTFETIDKEGYATPVKIFSFDPKSIIHHRRPNPSSMIWGLSPFIPGQRPILFNRYSTEYLNSFYQKGASPGIVLEMGDMANESNSLRLLRTMENSYTGRRNQRKPLVLPKGVTAKTLSHTLADQQLNTYISQNRETIIGLLKVPPHEVGLQKSGSLGSEEYKTALKNFWASTLKPTMRIIAGNLTHAFYNKLGENYFLEFDLSDVDILQEDLKQKADLATAMLSTRTLNETRDKVWADAPLPGGDKTPGIMPDINLPISQESLPQVEMESSDKIETPEANNPIDDLIKTRAMRADTWVKAKGTWFDDRQSKIDSASQKFEPSLFKLSIDMMQKQTIESLKAVKKFLVDEKNYSPMKSGIRVDHVGSRKSWVIKAEIKDKKELRRRIREAMDSFKADWEKGYTKTLDPTLDLGYNIALDVPFDIPSKDEITVLGDKNKDKRRTLLAARGLRTFADMSETTTEKIMTIITNGAKENLSVGEIVKNIVDKITNVDNIRSRAETIARTETLTAVSIGQAAAMKDAAKFIPNLKKMWLTAGDDRVRGLKSSDQKDHANMHGDVVKYDKDFIEPKTGEKIAYPRAPGGSAAMVINCRCTWVMLPDDEMKEVEKNPDNFSLPQEP